MSPHDLELALGLEVFGSVLNEWTPALVGMSTPVSRLVIIENCVYEYNAKPTLYVGNNPFVDWAKIIDCGDAPLTFLDNTIAIRQLEKAHKVGKLQLLQIESSYSSSSI